MRLLLTLAVLMAGCLAGSYALAPVPKEKPKTTAQKLIGTWKLVKLSNGASPTGEVTAEFKKDGMVVLCNDGVVYEDTYKVEGQTIHYHREKGPVNDRSVTLKSLSREELIAGDQHGYSVYKRIAGGHK